MRIFLSDTFRLSLTIWLSIAPQSVEDLLLKEGVYCAFGRSPSDLEHSISFDAWLDETLLAEASGTDPK